MVYFKYTTWRQLSGTINGKVKQLRTYLKEKVYTTPSLSPAVGWMLPDTQHGTVTGITKTALDNGSVTYEWDSVPNVRYVVYAVPESLPMSQFRCQPQYMLGISYTPRYTFPANLSEGYYHPITILDRWENEFAPAVYGSQVAQAEKPQLVYPANDATVPELAFLEWTGEEGYNYTLQVFADKAMTQIVANYATDSTAIGIADVPGLTPGKYYWRVVARGMNRYDNTSEMRSFTYEKMRITSPDNGSANVTLTPQFTWTTAQQGTNYTLEISTFASMASPKVYTTTDGTFTVPKYHLGGGTKYYARLTATYNGAQSTSDIISFTTADKVPATPQYIFPTEDGLTLYPHSQITFEPEEGIGSLRIEISTSTSFPVRSSYRGTIDDASFASPRLGDISGTVKPTDGKTYYVRARFAYLTTATGTTVQYTDYTPVLMFVYSTGVKGDVNGDGEINVQDVTALISYILGDTPEGFVIENAYINGDTNIDVQDVTALIAIILQ